MMIFNRIKLKEKSNAVIKETYFPVVSFGVVPGQEGAVVGR